MFNQFLKTNNMKTLFTTFAIVITFFTFSQEDYTKYRELVGIAMKEYQNKEYLKSGLKFSEAFVALGNKGSWGDRYNAGCAWALANQPDSAFVQLYILANKFESTNLSQMLSDKDFVNLYSDKRWDDVIAIIKANKEKEEKNYDKPLVAILDTIYQEDQKYRQQIDEIEKQFGRNSPEMEAHWNLIGEKDSINLIKVKKILDERGWLGADIISEQGNSTLFLVIQHSDLETQVKYLPMMREAVSKGKAEPSSLALLEDRTALGLGKKQIYGSQIGRDNETGVFFVLPLEDPTNVDKRREQVGLGTLQDYVSNWEIVWDVEQYIKDLPAIEAKQKK